MMSTCESELGLWELEECQLEGPRGRLKGIEEGCPGWEGVLCRDIISLDGL